MVWLNCTDHESALQSIAEALGAAPDDTVATIRSTFRFIEQEWPRPNLEVATALAETAGASRDALTAGFEGVIQFHATRSTDPDAYLKRGILPLADAIDDIWTTLRPMTSPSIADSEWASIRGNLESGAVEGHSAWLYSEKLADSDGHGGPFGRLVRDVHLEPPGGERDFLRNAPEIVEDIDAVLMQLRGASFYERYMDETVPCIIAFRSGLVTADLIGAAVHYLHALEAGKEVGTLVAGAGFSGRGRAVPPSEVVGVEVVDL